MSARTSRRLDRILLVAAMVAGGLTLVLGLVVVAGWHTANRTLIQVMPAFVPMQYNAALGFVFSGLVVLALCGEKRLPARIAGALLLLLGGMTLAEYVTGLDLGIDELFMKHDITVATSHPGRMAPNTALCFTLVGLAALCCPGGWTSIRRSAPRVILASLSLGLAVVALSGYVTDLETAYGWGNLTRMAVHTASGFIIASLGLLATAWRRDLDASLWFPRWLPIPVFVAILTAALCFWQAISAQAVRLTGQPDELGAFSTLGLLVLLAGALLAVAMATVAWLAQRSSRRAREVLKANRALEGARESTLKELMESSPDAMVMVDEAGLIRRMNQGLVDLFGYTVEELVGKEIERLIPKRFREGHGPQFASYFANPVKRNMGAGLVLHGLRKDGSEFPIEIGLSPFHEADSTLAIAAIRDITERRERERGIEEREKRFRTLVANIPGTVYRCRHDRDWTMVYMSEDVLELTGYPASDFVGNEVRSFGSVMHADDQERVAGDVEAAVEAGEAWTTQYRIRRADGEWRWLGETGRAIRDEGGEVRFLDGVILDVTRQREMEEQLRHAREQAETANRAKSEFLSHMSHELRTPLNGILGYAQILQRRSDVTPAQQDNLSSIISCGDHLLALINDVLDLSKIEAGKIELNSSPCDLAKLVAEVGDIVRQRATGKGLSFSLDVSPEVPAGIITDAAKLRQILVNLLGNAVKFTEKGGVTLRVMEEPKGMLRFQVVDTGIGLDEKEQAEIFDAFKQVEAGKAAGGTGLGLAISRRLAEGLGGAIEVRSERGKGSTFSVGIPLEEADVETLSEADAGLAGGAGDLVLAPGQDLAVLVADDRATNRDILQVMLEHAGFEVVLADDGDTALERLDERDFDVVLMDVRMPRMNGIEALHEIRSRDAGGNPLVIAVTASVFPEFREKAIAEGFDDFLGKPFRTEALMAVLRRHLDARFIDRGVPGSEVEPSAPGGRVELDPVAAARLKDAVRIRNLTAIKALAKELAADQATSAAGVEIARLADGFDFEGLTAITEKET